MDLTRLFLPFCFLEGIKVHNYCVKYTGTDLYTQFIHLCGYSIINTDKQRMHMDICSMHTICVNRYLLCRCLPSHAIGYNAIT